MKKLLILLMMVLMMTSLVSAGLTTKSISDIQFFGTDQVFNGPSFLVQVVENGGTDRISFSDLTPSDSYDIESSSGYIEGKSIRSWLDYPYTFNNKEFAGRWCFWDIFNRSLALAGLWWE